jgi:hypothetical protein
MRKKDRSTFCSLDGLLLVAGTWRFLSLAASHVTDLVGPGFVPASCLMSRISLQLVASSRSTCLHGDRTKSIERSSAAPLRSIMFSTFLPRLLRSSAGRNYNEHVASRGWDGETGRFFMSTVTMDV